MTDTTQLPATAAEQPGAGPPEPFAAPASYAQERVWFASQLARHAPVYHVQDRIPLRFDVPAQAVLDALATVTARHETLRTSLRLEGDELRQLVHSRVDPSVGHADVSGLPAAVEREARIIELMERLNAEPFRLDAAPLWRAMLVRYLPGEWHLLFVAHHTIVDAISQLMLAVELTELCAAAAAGREPVLPELPIQYADYAVWQRERLSGPALAALADHWRTVLAGLPAEHAVPTDRPRPVERSFDGGGIVRHLGESVLAALPGVCRRLGASPFMVLCAAYLALLDRLSGRHDHVVGVPVAGRDLPELQPLIGMFVNMVVLRVDTGGDPPFDRLVERVRQASLDMFEHHEMPYQKLVELLAARHDPAVPPLYQLGFNHLGQVDALAGPSGSAESDLMLEVTRTSLRLEYSTALFDAGTAAAIAEDYLRVLTTVLAEPTTRISALPVEGLARPVPAPVPDRPAPPAGRPFVAPRTPAEDLVAGVWAELLGVERVGADDDFFLLGGHSLLALRVIARLSAAAEVDLPIHAFFADTTVAGVASALEHQVIAQIDELSEEEAEQRLAAQDGRLG